MSTYPDVIAAVETAKDAVRVVALTGDVEAIAAAVNEWRRAESAVTMTASLAIRDSLNLWATDPTVAQLLVNAPATIRMDRKVDGTWTFNLTNTAAPRPPSSTPTEPKPSTATEKPRHRIVPTGETESVGSRDFLNKLAAAGNVVAVEALAKVDRAKADGKQSPGFDSTVKKLVAAGFGRWAE